MILEIALPVPVRKTFDYLAPSEDSGRSYVGCRVRVPFGFRPLTGIVVAEKTTTDSPVEKLKKVQAVIDEDPVLDEASLALGKWLSHRYLCSLGEALDILLPPGKNEKAAPGDAHHDFHSFFSPSDSNFVLTAGQKTAIEKIHEAVFNHAPSTFLLRGVAAAGKTEVYLSAIKDALNQGKSALYLVPEIGLCAQAAAMLKERFGEKNVCVYHSDISPKERFEKWWQIRRGEWHVVVGTRSAALLPLADMGVIIVDEEQDMAYKEDRKPRFHVRDLMLERGRQANAVVIFGSATPTLDIYEEAREGKITLLELDERAVLSSTPHMKLIDMKAEKFGILSSTLQSAIGERLKKGEQAILFLNRRGFHRYLRCKNCEWSAKCPKCGVTLVQHKNPDGKLPPSKRGPRKGIPEEVLKNTSLICHYCATTSPIPSSCPECREKKLYFGGTGTERVEDEIKEKFPWAHVARWDRDNVKKRGDQSKIFQEFSEGKIDVLVGTQLVAQGFNFPKVTLVGVVDADTPLRIPDFRAAERTFELVTQVAGRAGRELVTGDVIIQTRMPDHYALQRAAHMDYEGFAEEELAFRKDLNYPPFSNLIQIRAESKKAEQAQKDMDAFLTWIEPHAAELGIGILGPSPARRLRKGMSYQQVLLKIPKEQFRYFLDRFEEFLSSQKPRFWIDTDPS